jgi:hypothetical protein
VVAPQQEGATGVPNHQREQQDEDLRQKRPASDIVTEEEDGRVAVDGALDDLFGTAKRKLEGGTILDEHELMEATDDILATMKTGELINIFDIWMERVGSLIASTEDDRIKQTFSSDITFVITGLTGLGQQFMHHPTFTVLVSYHHRPRTRQQIVSQSLVCYRRRPADSSTLSALAGWSARRALQLK